MKTTQTESNIVKAKRLLELRDQIKLLQVEEKTLKAYFSDLIDTDKSLLVKTACVISKHEQTRSSFDTKALNNYFEANNIDAKDFKKTTTFNLLKVQGL